MSGLFCREIIPLAAGGLTPISAVDSFRDEAQKKKGPGGRPRIAPLLEMFWRFLRIYWIILDQWRALKDWSFGLETENMRLTSKNFPSIVIEVDARQCRDYPATGWVMWNNDRLQVGAQSHFFRNEVLSFKRLILHSSTKKGCKLMYLIQLVRCARLTPTFTVAIINSQLPRRFQNLVDILQILAFQRFYLHNIHHKKWSHPKKFSNNFPRSFSITFRTFFFMQI